MKRTRLFALIYLILLLCTASGHQASEPCGNQMIYENHNQVDPVALSVRVISGKVMDMDRIPVPGACIGVFTTEGELVSTTATDDEGRFQIAQVSQGAYRLVAKFDGFCVANVPLHVVQWPRGGVLARKRIVLHMQPVRVHHCSYGDYK